jgi:hypothetical protein
LIKALDAGSGYRDQIERDLQKRLARAAPGPKDPAYSNRKAEVDVDRRAGPVDPPAATRVCATCSTMNDADARFCKECGGRL